MEDRRYTLGDARGRQEMTNNVIRSVLPRPPDSYERRYLVSLSRALEQVIDNVDNPLTNIQALPTSEVANILQVGDIFEEEGRLMIKRSGDIFTGGHASTMSVGDVTVTTT